MIQTRACEKGRQWEYAFRLMEKLQSDNISANSPSASTTKAAPSSSGAECVATLTVSLERALGAATM